ncbi:hypothetical protein BJX63DRAFT_312846 [Aspergillus granulosus]|uniref:Uncharacterized protein n=1 Tax=Aspergillus granulosus TaxID=176169 RepID=A0ABR4HY88_9EURO
MAHATADDDLEALHASVTQPLLQAEADAGECNSYTSSYSWVLLEDHPLRSHPSEVECHPGILSFSRKCVVRLRRRWRESVLPLLCLVLIFVVIVQFLLQLPRVASYFLEPVVTEELPGFIQLSATLGQSASLPSSESSSCVYGVSPPLIEQVADDAVEAALTAGCTSVKADLWLRNHDLLVGSDPKSLGKERSLQTVYLQPLLSKLDALNSYSKIPSTAGNGTRIPDEFVPVGLYDNDPTQSFTLILNIRTPARTSWPRLVAQLRELDERGYLSYRNNTTQDLIMRPVVIVLAEECRRISWIDRLSRVMGSIN